MIHLGLLVVILVLAAGCGGSGSQRASVGGEVTLDGSPVEEGFIRIVPLEPSAGPSSGAPIRNGEYYVARDKGPPLAKCRFEVSATRKSGRKVPPASAFRRSSRKGGGNVEGPLAADFENNTETGEPNLNPMYQGAVDEWVETVPPQYNTESTLVLDVQAGHNDFDIHMKSQK